MAESRTSDALLARALAEIGHALDYPPTPALVPAVVARLEATTAARTRPRLPGLALWSRRRTLVVAAAALLLVLALAFAARLVIGAVEVRVVPSLTPSGSPFGASIERPVALADLSAEVGFRVRLPSGERPDGAFVVHAGGGEAALVVWDVSERFPGLAGTPWGQALLELPEGDEFVVKEVNAFEDVTDVRVGGHRAFWIGVPHELLLFGENGTRRFSVDGNVLIWQEGPITLRLETPLGRAAAIAYAETIA